jgi:hypothetical protein
LVKEKYRDNSLSEDAVASRSIEQFKKYLENQKDDFLRDGRRVEGIIRDIFPEEKTLISLLTSAWKAGVVAELRQTVNLEATIAQFSDRLCQEYGLKESAALTAVHVWADVLGVGDVVPDIKVNSTPSPSFIGQGNIPPDNCVCSFCGKDRYNVTKMVKGLTGCICNECIDLCNEINNKDKQQGLQTPTKLKGNATNTIQPPPGVRETNRDGRFIAYDNETILDTGTGLMWAAKDNGEDIDWQAAKTYCENYRGGGYTNWRMPTSDELGGLYDESETPKRGRFSEYILTDLFFLSHYMFWASESYRSDAVSFNFQDRESLWYAQSEKYSPVLPVRSG